MTSGYGKKIRLPVEKKTYTFREVCLILAIWTVLVVMACDWLMP